MTFERDTQAAARGVGDDLRVIGAELSGTLLRAWPVTLVFGVVGGGYLYLSLRTSAGWTGAAILMGFALLILAVPLGPWMLRRWRRQRVVAAWTTAVASVGLPPTRMERVEYRDTGERLHVRVTGGIAVDDLGGKVRHLEAALGAKVRVERDQDRPGYAFVTCLRKDPFAAMVGAPWPGLSMRGKVSYWEPAPVMRDSAGEEVMADGVRESTVSGGSTGTGKSQYGSARIAYAALDPSVTLYLIDGKRVELMPWASLAKGFASEFDDALQILNDVNREIDERASWLARQPGIRRKLEPEDGFGPVVVAIDELADFTLRARGKGAEFDAALGAIAAKGRFVAVTAIVATQVPYVNVISGVTRNNFPIRVAFRCQSLEQSRAILGDYSADASRLPRIPGRCYVANEDGTWIEAQTYEITDADLEQVIAIASERRGIRRSP